MFYIPTGQGEKEAAVTLTGSVAADDDCIPFYALDLDLLGQVTQELREQSGAVAADIRNGHVVIQAELASSAEDPPPSKLLVTVPYDRGWSITQNGEAIQPELWADLFYCFPLEPGNHVIEMTYHVPMLKEGICLSAAGMLILCLLSLPRRVSQRKNEK